jgi:hypothetical protein
MTKLESALQSLCRTLSSLGQEFALVGGLAVSARAEPRFTRDLDLAVAAADDSEAERIVHQLLQQGYQVLATTVPDMVMQNYSTILAAGVLRFSILRKQNPVALEIKID